MGMSMQVAYMHVNNCKVKQVLVKTPSEKYAAIFWVTWLAVLLTILCIELPECCSSYRALLYQNLAYYFEFMTLK